MTKLLSKKTYLILASILLIGFFLRAHDYKATPRFGATMDEFAWTWLGINLIQDRVPKSWSSHPQYVGHEREHLIFKGAPFWIVSPYLEHPPFFGIVAGSFALLNGAKNMYDLDIGLIRPLAIILGVLSIGILFLLIKEIYDESVALLAAFIYAIMPTVAIGSRIVQNENFFIPMFLLALLFCTKYLKNKKRIFLVAISIICGLLIVSKIPWVAATLGIVSILTYNKKYKESLIVVLSVFLFFCGFLLYGYFYDWNLFVSLWKLQLQRYDLTFNSVYALFKDPYMVDRYFIDGWIYFGWFSFVLLLIKDIRKNIFLIFGLLAYLAVFIFAIPNEPSHGWYRFPFYPFLAASIALFIKEYFNKNTILTFLFILLMILSLLELTWTRKFGFSFLVMRGFLFSSGITLLPLFLENKKIIKFSKGLNILFLIIIFSLSFFAVVFYNEL